MSNHSFSVLMEESFKAHQLFHRVRRENFATNLQKKESAEVTCARNAFLLANDKLWGKVLDPLQNRFLADPAATINDVIDFLEVDILAYRCGYLKEYFLERMKSVEITDGQRTRLKITALQLGKTNTVRREFRRWVNLMRQLADEGFIDAIHHLSAQGIEIRAAKIMLDEMLKSRKDLRYPKL